MGQLMKGLWPFLIAEVRPQVDSTNTLLMQQGRQGLCAPTVMLAVSVHAGSKSVTAGLTGGWRYLLALAPGLWAHTALCVAGIYVMAI